MSVFVCVCVCAILVCAYVISVMCCYNYLVIPSIQHFMRIYIFILGGRGVDEYGAGRRKRDWTCWP